MCVDYRKLNKLTTQSKYPPTWLNDLFDQVSGEMVFSNIYLWTIYYQLRIKDEDIDKTYLRTRYDNYEFVVLAFSLTNATATLMCILNNVLNLYLDWFLLVFINDILVYSKNE